MVDIAALDMWTLLVSYVFGGFWMSVVGIILILFILMGVLGRISPYTTAMYCLMFLSSMTLGYGYVTFNIGITLFMLLALIFSFFRWINSGQQ